MKKLDKKTMYYNDKLYKNVRKNINELCIQ